MNKMGFGFQRIPEKDGKVDYEQLIPIVDKYIEYGGYYFDTAYMYLDGRSEEALRDTVVARYPRESIVIEDKLPLYKIDSEEEYDEYVELQKKRCGVDYFDVFLLHWMNEELYAKAQRLHAFEYMKKLKEQGVARKIGFSFHAGASLLEHILSEHPETDVILLQINYLDWESQAIESRKCYEIAREHDVDIVVMEPLKGGNLVKLPQEALDILSEANPAMNAAQWGLDFVQTLDGVNVCLSGMNTMEQIEDNMIDFQPLGADEMAALEKVVEILRGDKAIPCTGCRYCLSHCPKAIPINEYIAIHNEKTREPDEAWKMNHALSQLDAREGAGVLEDCIGCGLCSKHCPQGLDIPKTFELIRHK